MLKNFHLISAFTLSLAVALLPTTAPSQPRAPQQSGVAILPPVHLDGTYFVRDGKRFIPVGAHWVPAKAAMEWPLEWEPQDIEADFAKMHELGYNIVRFDILWAWFEPRPGDYNPAAFKQLDFLISLANKYGIYLHPSLFIGGEVGEAYWDVPWRHGRHPHADPEMLRLETNLAAEFGRRYGKESAIIGWDLTDEPPFWIVGGTKTSDAMAINWTRLIADGLHENDKLHPIVVGTSGEEIGHGPFRADNISKFVDFFSVHPFTLYSPELFPDALLSTRGTYGAAFEIALSQGAGRPVMIHEMGASTAQFSSERVAAYDRAQIYSGLGTGAIGVDLWCFTDAAPEQFKKVPYLRTPQETGWGMTTWDRRDKPLAAEFKKLAALVGKLDLTGIAPAPSDAAIPIPDEWSKPHGDFSHFGLSGPASIPYVSQHDADAIPGAASTESGGAQSLMGSLLSSFILARQAGIRADFPREYLDWAKRPMLILPFPLTSTGDDFLTHLHTDFYEKLNVYVQGGGYVYASLAADSAIPNLKELFGAEMVDRSIASELTIKFIKPFGDFKPGDMLHYPIPTQSVDSWGAILRPTGGEVIAVDQDGNPALVTNSHGNGKTLLSAYPLEKYLAATPGAFEKNDDTHRLYDAFSRWTGQEIKFRANSPSIEVLNLTAAKRGYLFLVNHSSTIQEFSVSTPQQISSFKYVSDTTNDPQRSREGFWKMELPPFEVAVMEWKQ